MKMKTKILLVAIVPLLLLGAVTISISAVRISSVVTEDIEEGLQAAAVSVRETLAVADTGDYHVDEDGQLYKGSFNISENEEIADGLKQEAGMDLTIFYGDTRYMTSICDESGTRVVGTQAGETVSSTVLEQGKEYFATDIEVEGQPYYGYYLPLYDTEGAVAGMVFSGVPKAEAQSQISGILYMIIGVTLAIVVLVVIVLFIIVNRMVVSLSHGADVLTSVSEGKINHKIEEGSLKSNDEIGGIMRAIDKLQSNLSGIFSSVKSESASLAETSQTMWDHTEVTMEHVRQMEKAIDGIASGALNQAHETKDATEHIMQMGDMIEATTSEINHLNQSANAIKERGEEAADALQQLEEINEKTKDSIGVIYDQTNVTNESVQRIKDAITLITDIAEETTLLSLNASIEAARAGEQGRGFAVVASQIQKLAEQSNESAQKIETIIMSLIADSDKTVETMSELKKIMEVQSNNVGETNHQVRDLLSEVESAIDAIHSVSKKNREINEARKTIVDAVQNLSSIAEDNAANTEQTAASVSEINEVTQNIAECAGQLKELAGQMDRGMEMFVV
jgi:methyl-accepting chemotaxis protein